MIKMTVDTEALSIKAEGHSNFGKKGQDIVCAAVSILLYAYAAELLRIGRGSEILDSGDTFEIKPANPDDKIRIAYEMMMGGLILLEDEYSENMRIESNDNDTD